MRMMQQLANVLARIMRAREQEQYDEAQDAIDEAYGELFGLNAALLDVMSAESLAQLLGDKEKTKALARLFKEEGEVRELQGDATRAALRYHRSLELYLESLGSQTKIDLESESAIKFLLDKIDFEQLLKKYQAILKKMQAVSTSA
jgi:hypothetical protein